MVPNFGFKYYSFLQNPRKNSKTETCFVIAEFHPFSVCRVVSVSSYLLNFAKEIHRKVVVSILIGIREGRVIRQRTAHWSPNPLVAKAKSEAIDAAVFKGSPRSFTALAARLNGSSNGALDADLEPPSDITLREKATSARSTTKEFVANVAQCTAAAAESTEQMARRPPRTNERSLQGDSNRNATRKSVGQQRSRSFLS